MQLLEVLGKLKEVSGYVGMSIDKLEEIKNLLSANWWNFAKLEVSDFITFILNSTVFPAIWLVKNSAINPQIASFSVRLHINRTLSWDPIKWKNWIETTNQL